MISQLTHRLVRGSKGHTGDALQDKFGIASRSDSKAPLTNDLRHMNRQDTQSVFLERLPVDIRLIIYSYIFPPDVDTVHLEWRYSWLLPPALRKNSKLAGGLGRWHHSKCGIRIWLNSDRTGRPKCSFCVPSWREPSAIPLYTSSLFVCRQIYSESIGIFYTSLTLHFYSATTFRKFITAVPPQYLAFVRTVWFDWCLGVKELPHTSRSAKLSYDKVWEDLRSFSGLRVLCVTLESRLDHRPLQFDESTQLEKAWLGPLSQFSNLERCDISVGNEFQAIFQRSEQIKKPPYRICDTARTLNQSTGLPYRTCRSCNTTHGSVANNVQWVGGSG